MLRGGLNECDREFELGREEERNENAQAGERLGIVF